MRPIAYLIAATMLSGAAMAGTQDDVRACRVAVEDAAEGQFTAPRVTFESISGASLKTVTFTVTDETKTSTAVCTIKRGKVVSVDL